MTTKKFTDFEPLEELDDEDLFLVVDTSEDESRTVTPVEIRERLIETVRFGSTHFIDNTDLTNIPSAGTYVKINGPYVTGITQRTIVNDGRITLNGEVEGFYKAQATMTVDDGAGTLIGAQFYVIPDDGAPFLCAQCKGTSQIPPGGGEQSFVIQAIIPLVPGDAIEVHVTRLGSSGNLEIKNLNFDLVEIR